MEIVPLLKRLSEASGVSGYEHHVREVVGEAIGPFVDKVQVDALGNLVALKRGIGPDPRPAIMLATHMDEIGLIVSDLEKGFIRFQKVGGYDDRVLLGQEVLVHGRQDLPGVIGARPPHVLPAADQDQTIPYESLLIDVGLAPEQLGELVRIGDLVTMDRELVELKGGLVTGKALDNRVSVVAAAMCLEELGRVRHEWDVYAVATAQEEIGLKGAITGTFDLQPAVGIAIDVTWAKQPGVPDERTFELGQGPTIAWGPIFHPGVHKALVETAKALEMSCRVEPLPRPGGSDASAIQICRQGIPTGLLCIPQRNMHTPVETVSIRDIERTGRLLAAFIGRLDDSFLPTLSWSLETGEEA